MWNIFSNLFDCDPLTRIVVGFTAKKFTTRTHEGKLLCAGITVYLRKLQFL